MRIQEISDLTRLNIINTDDGNKKTGVFFVFFFKKKKIYRLDNPDCQRMFLLD